MLPCRNIEDMKALAFLATLHLLTVDSWAILPPDGKSGLNEDLAKVEKGQREEQELKEDVAAVKRTCGRDPAGATCQENRRVCRKNFENFIDDLENNPDTAVSNRNALRADQVRGLYQRAKENAPQCNE